MPIKYDISISWDNHILQQCSFFNGCIGGEWYTYKGNMIHKIKSHLLQVFCGGLSYNRCSCSRIMVSAQNASNERIEAMYFGVYKVIQVIIVARLWMQGQQIIEFIFSLVNGSSLLDNY